MDSWYKTYCYYSSKRIEDYYLKINEYVVQPHMGFPPTFIKNKEKIIFLQQGTLQQRYLSGEVIDLTKNKALLIRSGSKGTSYFEYNTNHDGIAKYLVFEMNFQTIEKSHITTKKISNTVNRIEKINSSNPLSISQGGNFYLGNFSKNKNISFQSKNKTNTIIVFLYQGIITVNGKTLREKEVIKIVNNKNIELNIEKESVFYLIEFSNYP